MPFIRAWEFIIPNRAYFEVSLRTIKDFQLSSNMSLANYMDSIDDSLDSSVS